MKNLTIHIYNTDELGHYLNTKAHVPQYFESFEIIMYNQWDIPFFPPKAVVGPVVIFTTHGVLHE